VFDTQEIIERAHLGDLDYVKHALTLFVDFVAVLVRILIVMVCAVTSIILLALVILSFFDVWLGHCLIWDL